MLSFAKIVALSVLVVGLFGTGTYAGFRCSVAGGFLSLFSSSARDGACSASCVAQGKTSGACTDDEECICSEFYIDLDTLKALVPSRCDLDVEVCRRTCHAIGRREGMCLDDKVRGKKCKCTEDTVSAEEFGRCAAETTCRLYCQTQGSATGVCNGWSCECQSSA